MNKIIDAVKTVAAAFAEISDFEKQRKQEQVSEEREPKNMTQKFLDWQQTEEEKWQRKQSKENPCKEMFLLPSEIRNFKNAIRNIFPNCNYNGYGAYSAELPYQIDTNNMIFCVRFTSCEMPITMTDNYRQKIIKKIYDVICEYYLLDRPEHLRFVLDPCWIHVAIFPESKGLCVWFAYSLWGKNYLDNFIRTSFS